MIISSLDHRENDGIQKYIAKTDKEKYDADNVSIEILEKEIKQYQIKNKDTLINIPTSQITTREMLQNKVQQLKHQNQALLNALNQVEKHVTFNP